MDKLFRKKSQTIWVILSKAEITDPYELTKRHVKLNPLPLKALVSDVAFSQIQWKMPGIVTDKVKEIIIKKKRKTLLLQSYKIKIENEVYNGYKVNGRLQYRQEGDYIRAYVYIEQETTDEV